MQGTAEMKFMIKCHRPFHEYTMTVYNPRTPTSCSPISRAFEPRSNYGNSFTEPKFRFSSDKPMWFQNQQPPNSFEPSLLCYKPIPSALYSQSTCYVQTKYRIRYQFPRPFSERGNGLIQQRTTQWITGRAHTTYFPTAQRCRLGSRDNVVGIATGYGLCDQGVGVRVPVGSRIFSSPQSPDRLCSPSNEYQGLFPRV
jgi:hypothetical protein